MSKYTTLQKDIERLERKICKCKEVLSGSGAPTDPPTSNSGLVYVDTDTGDLYYWDGSAWQTAGGGAFTVTDGSNPFAVAGGDTVLFRSPDSSVLIDTQISGEVRFQAINASLLNDGIKYGGVEYQSGLSFETSDIGFVLAGVYYTAAADSFTLAAADPTNPRIDVIVVNTDGTVSVVQGTPAASPSKPSIDPIMQVEVTFVQVDALATDVTATVDKDAVYLENAQNPTEWDVTITGANIVSNSTADPYAGTINIEGTNVTNGEEIEFSDTLRDTDTLNQISLRIKSKGSWGNNGRLQVGLYSGTTSVSRFVKIDDSIFDTTDTANYQLVVLNAREFQVKPGTFDTIKIVKSGSSNIGFYIDNIYITDGLPENIAEAKTFYVSDGSIPADTERIVDFSGQNSGISFERNNASSLPVIKISDTANSGSAFEVFGNNTSQNGLVYFNNTSDNHLLVLFKNSTGLGDAPLVVSSRTTNATSQTLLTEYEFSHSGVAGDAGFGAYNKFSGRNVGSVVHEIARYGAVYEDATNTDEFGAFYISAIGDIAGAGTLSEVFRVSGSGAMQLAEITAAQASAITASNGMIVYVNSPDATFTSVGFWGRENGAWVKL